MFTNVMYAGHTVVKVEEQTEYVRAHWYDQRYVDLEEIKKCIELVRRPEKSRSKLYSNNADKYYLKSVIISEKGNKLTASRSKGRSKYYHYYYDVKEKRKNISVDLAHEIVEEAINAIQLKPLFFRKAKRLVNDITNPMIKSGNSHLNNLNKKIQELDKRRKKIKRLYISEEIDITEYREFIQEIDEELEKLNLHKHDAEQHKDLTEQQVRKMVDAVMNIGNIYKRAKPSEKTKILHILFPEGFFLDLESRRVRTAWLNEYVLNLIDYQSIKNIEIIDNMHSSTEILSRVDDGIRTHDPRYHKPML